MQFYLNIVMSSILKLCKIIEDFLSPFFNFLDNAARINVFFIYLSILAAVVIFIAELSLRRTTESEKKLMLQMSKIKYQMIIAFAALFLIWMSEDVKENCVCLYFVVSTIKTILIISSMVLTLSSFRLLLRINTDKEYFNVKLDKYIKNTIIKINKKLKKDKKKKNKRREKIEQFINSSEIIKYNDELLIYDEGTNFIFSENDGYITGLNSRMINNIIETTTRKYNDLSDKNVTINLEAYDKAPDICFMKNIGDRIYKNHPIIYYKNIDDKIVEKLKYVYKTKNHKLYIDDEVNCIIDDLFKLAENEDWSFDTNGMLKNFYLNILDTENRDFTIDLFKDKIWRYYNRIKNDNKKKINFTNFLIDIAKISLDSNKYSDFEYFCSWVTICFVDKLEDSKCDHKQLSYDYVNIFFRRYYLNKEKDIKYYNCLLSNLLKIIEKFFNLGIYDAALILLKNAGLNIDQVYARNKSTLSDFEKSNFQFFIGMFYLIIYNNKIENNISDDLREIVEYIKDKYFLHVSAENLIDDFYSVNETNNIIKNTYENFNHNKEDNKYLNMYTSEMVSYIEVLKLMIYSLELNSRTLVNDEVVDVLKWGYYQSIIDSLEKESYPKLEKYFNFDSFDSKKIISHLRKLIEVISHKKNEYLINNKLDVERINYFRELVVRNKDEKHSLYNSCKINNLDIFNDKIQPFTLTSTTARRIFFSDEKGIEEYARYYGVGAQNVVESQIFNEIKSKSKRESITIEEKLKNISKNNELDDYIIIASGYSYLVYENEYYSEKNKIKIEDNYIEIIISDCASECVLIKRDDFPTINNYNMSDKYDNKLIIDKTFIEVTDLSNHKDLRDEIIKTLKSSNKITDENQTNNDLRTMCYLKIAKSFEITSKETIKSFIFENRDLDLN